MIKVLRALHPVSARDCGARGVHISYGKVFVNMLDVKSLSLITGLLVS